MSCPGASGYASRSGRSAVGRNGRPCSGRLPTICRSDRRGFFDSTAEARRVLGKE